MTSSSPSRPLIVLSLEGLARASLGCYGCSWNQTPAIDAIAAGGIVWDRLIAESDDPSEVLHPWMASGWAQRWHRAGTVELVTDTGLAGPDCFQHVTRLPATPPPDHPAGDIVETQLGRLVAAAVERDQQASGWSVMWIHSDTLTRCWDAPRELYPLEQLDGDDDLEAQANADQLGQRPVEIPSPPRIFPDTTPPSIRRTGNEHPDLVSSWMRTYACQVRLVDVLIEVLLHSLDVHDPWFMLVGTSGYRLGQAGWIGSHAKSLRSANIHLPWLISDLGPLRVPRLLPSGVVPQWLDQLADEHPSVPPEMMDTALDQDVSVETKSTTAFRAVTSPGWFYVQDQNRDEHLFLKPDDVEDFNDVARVRKEVLRKFRGIE